MVLLYILVDGIYKEKQSGFCDKKEDLSVWNCRNLFYVADNIFWDRVFIIYKLQFDKINTSLSLSTYYIDRYHTIPEFFCSIFLFFFFQKTEIKYSKAINGISKGCFGIYILHQAPGFAKYMWLEIFKTQKWLESEFYAVYFIGTVLMIFIAGSIVDLIRRKYVDKKIDAGKLSEAINRNLDKLYSDF